MSWPCKVCAVPPASYVVVTVSAGSPATAGYVVEATEPSALYAVVVVQLLGEKPSLAGIVTVVPSGW